MRCLGSFALLLWLLAMSLPAFAQLGQSAQSGQALTLAMGSSPQMSLSTFRSRCNMYDGPAGSGMYNNQCGPGDQDDLCHAFADMLAAGSPGQEACIRSCSAQRALLSPRYSFNGCQYVLDNAYAVCSRYCRNNFPDAPGSS